MYVVEHGTNRKENAPIENRENLAHMIIIPPMYLVYGSSIRGTFAPLGNRNISVAASRYLASLVRLCTDGALK